MSTKKPRKSLDDALAREFVYGQDEQAVEEPTEQHQQEPELPPLPTVAPTPQPTKPSIMSQLEQPSKEPTIRLTVDLPESMHRKLSMLAARTNRKKVEIVRFLLDEALKEVEE
ncbi:CopG family transcriptional regulator [Nostoc sp. FACHB-87]|uniref:CopG family transcriptional regulator n=1 Tax=Nostocaceae TaxID=1162 RepID=UPI0016832B3A|nr:MULTISPECIES: CopG family transcriptional regulator [Nostocaceae]MBD2458422.1 CopG family transcriptional regulator [Nostoc sp. FACHB-87]MBD2479482.1 CopG family transcriptional regulator [Anabaena sp. FACHB-83]